MKKTYARSANLMFTNNKLSILPRVILKQEIFSKNDTIVFIHHPKTGGSNMAYLAKALLPAEEIRMIVGKPFSNQYIDPIIQMQKNPERFDCINRSIKYIAGHIPLPEENYFNIIRIHFCF